MFEMRRPGELSCMRVCPFGLGLDNGSMGQGIVEDVGVDNGRQVERQGGGVALDEV